MIHYRFLLRLRSSGALIELEVLVAGRRTFRRLLPLLSPEPPWHVAGRGPIRLAIRLLG